MSGRSTKHIVLLTLTPALLASLAGCSLGPRPLQTAAPRPAETVATAATTPEPASDDPFAISPFGEADSLAPGSWRTEANAGHPGAAKPMSAPRQVEATPAAQSQSAGTPSVFGEIPAAGASTMAASNQTHDYAENLRQVSFAQIGADFDPDISRDGKWAVFASTQHSKTADIYIKPIDSQTVTQLTHDPGHDVMPAMSPDGRRIAFASNRSGSWDLYVMSSGGGQPIQLTHGAAHELHPSWSPDGKHLAFCRLNPNSGRWELWVMDVMNPGVARFLGHGLFPSWSPVGDTIAFQRSRERGDRFFSIWTIDYVENEGVNPTEIASSPVAAFINPTWSPDGKRLAFAAIPNPHGGTGSSANARPHAADLWMVDLDGSSRSRLTGGQFVNLMPAWGPDWKLYFVSDRSGVDNIWSLHPERALIAATGAAPGPFAQRERAPAQQPGQQNRAAASADDVSQFEEDLASSPFPPDSDAPAPVIRRRTAPPSNFVFAPDGQDSTGPER